MELAGVLPPPAEKPGRKAKAAPAGASSRDDGEDSGEADGAESSGPMDDDLDAGEEDLQAPLLMDDEDGLDESGRDGRPDRNPPEIDPAA